MHDEFQLGSWTIRPTRLLLERDGELIVHVKPKTMEVLVALAERRGEVLSRDDLLARVWQNAYVSDDVITQAIGELRRALRDDFRRPVFIETVPRRGYRLMQPVRLPDRHGHVGAPAVAEPFIVRPLFLRAALAGGLGVALVLTGLLTFGNSAGRRDVAVGQQRAGGPVERRLARPTHDTEAYELYLKAVQAFHPHRSDLEQMNTALSRARKAVERDPGFAEAHALIAEIQTFQGFWNHGAHEERLTEATQAAAAALAIDPRMSYPHAVRGLATAVLEWKWEEGYRDAVRATELDPDDGRSLSLRAILSLTRGKPAEAVRLAYRAYELDPISPHALGILSWVLYQARDYENAATFMAKTLEVDPDALFARNFRPLALAYAGRIEEALAAENARAAETGKETPMQFVAFIQLRAGRRNEARRLMERLAQAPPGEAIEAVWVHLGEKEIVFERLERMVEKRMTNYLMWLRTGPAWDSVRDDPRFQKVLERVGLVG